MVRCNHPLVTIAIPTFNRGDSFLPGTLRSAIGQSYENLQIIVSDNCSTDNTADVVSALADHRVEYHCQDVPVTPNRNFNTCLRRAQGEYFLLLHDDDLIDADFVAACIERVNRCPKAALIRTGTRIIDEKNTVVREFPNLVGGLPTEEFFLGWFNGRTSPWLCSSLFMTEKLRAVGGFHSGRNLFQDVMAEFKLAARYGRADIPDILASARRHPGEITFASKVSDWCEDSLELLDMMCHLAPSAKKDIRRQGMRTLSYLNYTKAAAVRPWPARLAAFATVYKAFGYRHTPLRLLVNKGIRAPLRGVRQRGRALLPRTAG